jgi:hypothetical protein
MKAHWIVPLLALVFTAGVASAQFRVTSTSPTGYSGLGTDGWLDITFNEPVDRSTVDGNVTVFGQQSGPRDINAEYLNNDQTIRLRLAETLQAGEWVDVAVPSLVRGVSGAELTHGYWISVWAASTGGQMQQVVADRWSPAASSAEVGFLYSTGLHSGDLNGDGWTDLSVSNAWASDLRTFYGGDGGISRNPVVTELGQGTWQDTGNWPTGITTADINRDGRLDLLVTSPWMAVDGADGGFAPHRIVAEGTGDCGTPVVFDADGDGDQDLLGESAAALQVLANDGSGQFSPTGNLLYTGFSGSPWNCMVADFDLDGIIDLLASRGSEGTVIFRGLGGGAFVETSRSFQGNYAPVVGDLDEDGVPDLVVARRDDKIRAFPSGDFSRPVSAYITGDGAIGLKLADLDGDGDLDVAEASWEGVIIHENRDGDLSNVAIHELGKPLAAIVVSDRDNDGDLDVAALVSMDWSSDLDELILLQNEGTATLLEVPHQAGLLSVYPNPVDGHMTLETPQAVPVELVDVLGRIVLRIEPGTRSVDVSGLPSGVYLVRSIDGSGAATVVVR